MSGKRYTPLLFATALFPGISPPETAPQQRAQEIVGVSPDFVKPSFLEDNEIQEVVMNFSGPDYQPDGCKENNKIAYNNTLLCRNRRNHAYMTDLAARAIRVTGIIAATPVSQRRNSCKQSAFCQPKNKNKMADFTAYIADTYPQVEEFVIGNEVNSADWYDLGCKDKCDFDTWVTDYADLLDQSYASIKEHNQDALVLIPFTNHFGPVFDSAKASTNPVDPSIKKPLISMLTFIDMLAAKGVFDRMPDLRIAPHLYNKKLTDLTCSPNDYPYVTVCNAKEISKLLLNRYPQYPWLADMYATEQGIPSKNVSDEVHGQAVCQMLKEALKNPHIKRFIVHRLFDHQTEVNAGLSLGLVSVDNTNAAKKTSKLALNAFLDTVKGNDCAESSSQP